MLTIKKASAGSGKTFTLARQYITLLLGKHDPRTGRMRLFTPRDYGFLKPKPHSHILAITFTKKATREMTERILAELALLAEQKESDHLEHLCGVFSASPGQIAQAARRALADLLFNFSAFNVSTIDSFFQNILRVFTRELDLPEVFNLEIDENYPVAVATAEMFSSINLPSNEKDPRQARSRRLLKLWMQQYMESLLEEGKNANLLARSSKVNRQLVATLTGLRSEIYKSNRETIREYLADPENIGHFVSLLDSSLKGRQAKLAEAARQFLCFDEAALLPAILRKTTLDLWAADDFSYDPTDGRLTLANALTDPSKRHNKPKKGQTWPDDVDSLLVNILQRGAEYFFDRKFYRILRRQIYLLGLFSHSERHIEDFCRDNESFLLGDTNLLLRKVINEAETPFIYERVGTTINHFLIDEFQDTSLMQWENLDPLLRESMGRKQDDLIIGDVKQCIYRFRNSKPELLGTTVEQQMKQTFGKDAVEVLGNDITDNTNWRSMRNVVMFNNTLFKRLAVLADREVGQPMAVPTYSALVQQVSEKHLKPCAFPGYVKVLFGPIPSPEEKNPPAGPIPDSPFPIPDSPGPWTAQEELYRLADEIGRQLSAGYRPKDIAILVRRHSEGEQVIQFLLEEMGKEEWQFGRFPIMSDDALEISSSPAVQLIIGILRLCTTPQYILDHSKAREEAVREENRMLNPAYLRNRLIHRYELCRFDRVPVLDEEGRPLLDEQGRPVTKRISPEEALAKAIRATAPAPGDPQLDPLQKRLDAVIMDTSQMDCPSIFAIVERIIQECLPSECLAGENAFISSFQDLVLDFEEKGDADIESFLEWWDTKGHFQTLPPPEGMDALRVMTIHQAKGLEMPCVHIPFCESRIYKLDTIDWYRLDRNGFPGIPPSVVPPFIPLAGSSKFSEFAMLAPQFTLMKQTQMIDCLNVMYVAFTRAVDELIVYCNPVKGKPGETYFGKLLYQALSSDNIVGNIPPSEAPWLISTASSMTRDPLSGVTTFELGESRANMDRGEPATVNGVNEEEGTATGFDAVIDYEGLISSYISARPAEMIITDDIEQQAVFDPANERHRGNFLHDALAHVRSASDLPRAMERAAYRRALPPAYWQPLLRQLAAALADPRVRPWFEGFDRLLNERPLTAPSGLRRPDRVVFHPDGSISVIDYKFGSPTEKYREKYRDQVRDYIALLTDCGYRNIRGYLFYPLSCVIYPVS